MGNRCAIPGMRACHSRASLVSPRLIMRPNFTQAGYGLLLIMLFIMGLSLSASMVTITAGFFRDQENVRLTQEKLKKIAVAISNANLTGVSYAPRSFEQDRLTLPASLTDLTTTDGTACTFVLASQVMTGWCGPYWSTTFTGESAFLDAWGRTIVYDSAGRRIYSIGPNNTDNNGGSDDLVQTF